MTVIRTGTATVTTIEETAVVRAGGNLVSQGDGAGADPYFFSSVITLQAGAIEEAEAEQAISGSWKVPLTVM